MERSLTSSGRVYRRPSRCSVTVSGSRTRGATPRAPFALWRFRRVCIASRPMRPGFSTGRSAPVVVGASADIRVTLVLQIGPLAQHVVVTASATEVPLSQVGSPVTVIDAARLQDLAKSDVLESLKTVPGTFVLQTGQRGGQTDIFVRGGAPDFNKVLIDGVPANDIGGAFDFGILSAAGIDRVEVLRTANSVLYGADALSGSLVW